MKNDFELWSIKEQRVYSENNAKYIIVDNVAILATPNNEPLVLRKR